jgi:hypothetical protein
MLKESLSTQVRKGKVVNFDTDLAIVGGGMSGVCAAITAARQGIKVVLVQDRPVLGGNGSSEIRLWILGATSHMGNNNRWAREGGIIDEILVENLYRNSDGNPLILDSILLEKVVNEKNITLLLNTSVYDLTKSSEVNIKSITAFCSQNSTTYNITAPFFCDASGDGIISFKAGASYRVGAESKDEFGELFAPDKGYGELLGHTLYFYSKRADRPVKYVPPSFALKDIKEIPRYKIIHKDDKGCRFWWLEYGGRRDTVHDTEEIKWELWKVVYGIWDYIKNSGEFDDVEDLTLEWVGTIPGKRESRRVEGLYMLKQQDLVEQRDFDDAVAYGGWAIDLHPADGVYSKLPACNQYHTKGIYQIPYRALISKDVENLFLAGRIISATHVAFGSTRVMATSAFCAQAIGMAASICLKERKNPAELLSPPLLKCLQNRLNKNGQSIPNIPIDQATNLAAQAEITSSSSLIFSGFPADGSWYNLKVGVAQMLPLQKGMRYSFKTKVFADEPTIIKVLLQVSSKTSNYTPDVLLESVEKTLIAGEQEIELIYMEEIKETQYAFLTFLANEKVKIAQSSHRLTGILSVFNGKNKAVSNNGKQTPPEGIGFDTFEFWIPNRRPEGKNLAISIHPSLNAFGPENLVNGFVRPWLRPNAWVSDPSDPEPQVMLAWDEPKVINEIKLFLDTDYDHPLESVLMGHPEDVIPFCVRNFSVYDENMQLLFDVKNNYQTIVTLNPNKPIVAKALIVRIQHPSDLVPASVFQIEIM